MIEGLISAREAADLLGISATALHRLCARGKIGCVWLSGRRLFSRSLILRMSNDPDYWKHSRSARANAKRSKPVSDDQEALDV